MKRKKTHGALALSLIFVAHLGGCDTTGRSYIMLPLADDSEPPPPCGPLCATCSRECAPLPAKDFIGPYLLWYGENANDAVCPEHAPTIVFRGHAGLLPMARNWCAACYCTPGRCVFPEGISASETSDCEGLEDQPLDAQNIWLDPNASASVSSPESVQELLSSQPAALFVPPVSIAPCAPMEDTPPPPTIEFLPWQYTGVACSGIPRDDECSDASTTCVPVADDYTQCILYRGSKTDPECPSPYPAKLVLYRGVQNTRTCTRCDCGPPEGGECAARVLALRQKDHPTVASSTTVTREEPGCITRDPGMQIASLQAGWLTNHPASCLVSGGERTGEYGPRGAQVLCCQTQPIPKKRQVAGADPDAGSGDP